jgi:Flp pilus assembly protein TadD
LAYSSASLIYQALIGTLIKQGKDQEACRYLIHASGLPGLTDEQRFDFHKSLGNCYARLGDLDRAAYQYEKAYELFPQSDTLQINVGSLALQKADYQSAKEHFEAALEANPKNEKAYNGLGMVYMSLGNMQKAHDHFVTALNFDPTNLGALNNLVKTSYELNQFQQAIHAIESYMNLKPESRNSTNILYCYCSILYHQGHLHTAKSEAERILSINPQHSGAKEILALIKSANQGR